MSDPSSQSSSCPLHRLEQLERQIPCNDSSGSGGAALPDARLCCEVLQLLLVDLPGLRRPDLVAMCGHVLLFGSSSSSSTSPSSSSMSSHTRHRHLLSSSTAYTVSVWDVLEAVAMAALELNDTALAERCVAELQEAFPDSLRVWRVACLLRECLPGQLQSALAMYDRMQQAIETGGGGADTAFGEDEEQDAMLMMTMPAPPADDTAALGLLSFIARRRVAIAQQQQQQRTQSQRQQQQQQQHYDAAASTAAAISALADHLSVYGSSDVSGSYEELCRLYLCAAVGDHERAAHCVEEAMLHEPHNHLHHTLYADIAHTQHRYTRAKRHYAKALDLLEENSSTSSSSGGEGRRCSGCGGGSVRALYGLALCGSDKSSGSSGPQRGKQQQQHDSDNSSSVDDELVLEAKRQLLQRYREAAAESTKSSSADLLYRVAEAVLAADAL